MTSVSTNGRTASEFPCAHRVAATRRAGGGAAYTGPKRLLDAETEAQLIKAWQARQDQRALERLVTSYQVLVAKIAARYRTSGIPMEDLISEGNVGLMNAIGKFDLERGYRLSTYAMWWIRAAISDLALGSSSIVRGVSTERQKRIFFALRRTKSRMSGTEPGSTTNECIDVVSETLGISHKDVEDVNTWMESKDLSVNVAPEFEESTGEEWQEFLVDDAADPETRLLHADEQSKRSTLMRNALETLDDRERHIVLERHLAEEPSKLSDIGDHFGITRERVRQIETRALEKLRRRVRDTAHAHGLMGEHRVTRPAT